MDKYFSDIQKPKKQASSTPEKSEDQPRKALPKGVVLGKDGKPCRSCTSISAWAAMAKQKSSASPTTSTSTSTSTPITAAPPLAAPTPAPLPPDCPADVETLGRSTWTFLHTLSASYPPTATPTQQSEMKQFMNLFSKLYPCWHCAEDFQEWMRRKGNEPRVAGRGDFGRWMCEAHNEVNRKLGKREFDCGRWEVRWREGPEDGSCG